MKQKTKDSMRTVILLGCFVLVCELILALAGVQ